MPYTQIIYQIVYATKYREHTLVKRDRKKLFVFMEGVLQKKRCHVFGINGVEDHIHIIMCLHPSVSLAGLIKDIKLASTDFIKKNKLFPDFNGWQNGYGAFTYSVEAKSNLIAYVKNQENHHRLRTSKEELIKCLANMKYLMMKNTWNKRGYK